MATRRLLRQLFVSRVCQILQAKIKNTIWRYLPRKCDDEQRERFLWYVKQCDFDWNWAYEKGFGRTCWLDFYDDPEIMTACMSCRRNAERGMEHIS